MSDLMSPQCVRHTHHLYIMQTSAVCFTHQHTVSYARAYTAAYVHTSHVQHYWHTHPCATALMLSVMRLMLCLLDTQ